MKKVLVKTYREGLPVELIGKIVTVNEDFKIVSEDEFNSILLDRKEVSILTYDEPDELLIKVLNSEKLTDREIEDLFWEYDNLCVIHDKGENRRWSSYHTKTLNIYGRYFEVSGDIALTESGEHMFDKQPYEVKFKPKLVQRIIFETVRINKIE